MTVAHQYSTLKNEKITHTQYRTQFKQSVHNLIHNLTSQYSSICEHMWRQVPRWLCDIQLMGVLDRLEK